MDRAGEQTEDRQPAVARSNGSVVAEASRMRRLGTMSGTRASYHVRFGESGLSYPRDAPTPDRLGLNPAGRGRGGSWCQEGRVTRRSLARRSPAGRRREKGTEKGREKGREEGRIADIIRPVVAAAGMDLESVRVSAAGRRRLLRVVVDSDQGVSLDDAATISRQLSAALDTVAVMGDFPYTLEVSSPGVDRPLIDPRHWRRAVGRLVQVTVSDAGVSGVSGFRGFRVHLRTDRRGRLGWGHPGRRGYPAPVRVSRARRRRRPGGVRAPATGAWSDPRWTLT